MRRTLIVLLALSVGSPAAAESPASLRPGAEVAFLGITFIDTSTEGAYFGERPDEAARIDLLEDEVRERFTAEGLVFADLAPVQDQLDTIVNPAECYGCDIRMAQELGSDYVMVGEVQKVSNLILSMNLVVKDGETGEFVRGQSVEIRSNTDDSWLRGMRYILKNNIFKE